MRSGIWLIIVFAAFALGLYLGTKICLTRQAKSNIQVDVITEQIKDVLKFVNVEGEFTEIFNRKEYTWFDISPFRKSAIMRVKAKVLAGYNLDNIQIQTDEKSKTITLSIASPAEILSVEHKLDYYDMQQGTFNYFTPDELTSMQEAAVNIIKQKAQQSDLLTRAAERQKESLQWLGNWAEAIGWKVQLREALPSNKN